MILKVKAYTKSSFNKIIEKNGIFNVYVSKSPVDNKANKAIIELLSDELDISKSRFRVIKGAKSRDKVIEII